MRMHAWFMFPYLRQVVLDETACMIYFFVVDGWLACVWVMDNPYESWGYDRLFLSWMYQWAMLRLSRWELMLLSVIACMNDLRLYFRICRQLSVGCAENTTSTFSPSSSVVTNDIDAALTPQWMRLMRKWCQQLFCCFLPILSSQHCPLFNGDATRSPSIEMAVEWTIIQRFPSP